MNTATYVAKTIELMEELRVPVRDTYSEAQNFDDFFTNGNQLNGPRLLKIEWVETTTTGYPEVKGKIYPLKQHASIAYDAFSISMPNRYLETGRDDPIIHELVHFLQHNTTDEDSQYISFNGQNYYEYLSQRVELEAHAVQVLYILRENPKRCTEHLAPNEQERVIRSLQEIAEGAALQRAISALLLCKERQLI